eukprot:CAMPEP_0195251630 /NCGR_PEP_ID=MMETSP0706-20130129/3389_1 /TAXON_ID=33640 /ORGANISM="Asterionellopsis glacialis, Strain CCMP134" /LENGTH=123 /DNA_ID=CAMNT_0040303787 /DNA_START=41 /DNA_END=409 /DNA_ORIENTATION=-
MTTKMKYTTSKAASDPEPMDTASDDHQEQNSANIRRAAAADDATEKKRSWWHRRSKSDGNLAGMASTANSQTNGRTVPQQTLLVPNVRGKKRSFRNPQDSIKVAYRKGKKNKNKESADPSKGW